MTHNSILKLIGHHENVFLSNEAAKKVNEIFSNNDIPSDFVIRIKNPAISFKKGTIRMIEVNPDSVAGDQQKSMEEFYAEERENRANILSWSSEAKAGLTDIFESIYKISSGVEAPKEAISEAVEIQTKFFNENPTRTICDLNLLKPIIPAKKNIITPFESAFFRIIEKAVVRDINLSDKSKK